MNTNNPIAPLPPRPVASTPRTDYHPTRREEHEGQRHQHGRQGSEHRQGGTSTAQGHATQTLPDGTFIDSLTSLDPIFDRYRHRIPHICAHLSEEQRHLLGALYATAAHRGYDLSRIDAIARRFAMDRTDYANRTLPNPLATSGLVIDTQA